MRVVLQITLMSLLLSGCGAASNLNRLIFVAEEDEQAADALYEKARISYDKGDFNEALKLAELAVGKNHDHEKASVLLGYINLSLAGFDVFNIAKKLSSMSTSKDGEAQEGDCEKISNADTGETLDAFNCLINLTSEDVWSLAEADASGEIERNSENPFFADLPVIYPKKLTSAEEDPREEVPVLKYLKAAIMAVCPYVNAPEDLTAMSDGDVRSPDDFRHSCEPTIAKRKEDMKAHFLWALAHLLEAVVFNNVLLYQGSETLALAEPAATSTQASANLLKRVNALNGREFAGADIANYIEAVDELSTDIENIFDPSATSMLRTVLVDLQVTVNAFGSIPGIPDKMVSSISKALENIEKAADELGVDAEGQPSLATQTQALKGKLNKSVSKNLGTSIDKFAASDGVTPQQVVEVCAKFESISNGLPEKDLATMRPTSCQ